MYVQFWALSMFTHCSLKTIFHRIWITCIVHLAIPLYSRFMAAEMTFNRQCFPLEIHMWCLSFQLEDVGELTKLRIGHDNAGLFAGWHLDKVEVRTLNNASGKVKRKIASSQKNRLYIITMSCLMNDFEYGCSHQNPGICFNELFSILLYLLL